MNLQGANVALVLAASVWTPPRPLHVQVFRSGMTTNVNASVKGPSLALQMSALILIHAG